MGSCVSSGSPAAALPVRGLGPRGAASCSARAFGSPCPRHSALAPVTGRCPGHGIASRAVPAALAVHAARAAAGRRCRKAARRSAEASWHDRYSPPVLPDDSGGEPVRFEPGDPAAVEHLREMGYAVFGGVLGEEEAEQATGLFWNYIEQTTGGEVRRGCPETWGSHRWPAQPHNGIINSGGIGQSAFMWYVRTRPRVLSAFAGVWGLERPEDLIVSFDGGCAFRPPAVDPTWRTRSGWLHTDQNGMTTGSGFTCVQGFVSLTDSDESTGGFLAIPGSHKQHADVFRRWPLERDNDFFVLPRSDPLLSRQSVPRPRLVPTRAGDLLVWDSRCIHCNVPGRHRFDAASLSEALDEAGLRSCSEFVLRELTSVADAAWIATTSGAQRTRSLLAEWGVSARDVEPVAAQFERWARELAEELVASRDAGLTRLAAYVCACPREHADPGVVRMKRGAALLGATTTHWPDRMVVIDTALGQGGLADIAGLDFAALRLMGCEGETWSAARAELAADAHALAARAAPEHAEVLWQLAARLDRD